MIVQNSDITIDSVAKTLTKKEAGKEKEESGKKESKGGASSNWTPERGGDQICRDIETDFENLQSQNIITTFLIVGGSARGGRRCCSNRNWRIKWMKDSWLTAT